MKELNFKPLTAEQIEVRPTDTKTQGKCTLLLYIDSRCAAQIMNDTVGVMNWQMEYKDVAGQIYGRLSIYDDEKNIWVSKEDTGSEGNIEAEKSRSSDILKRCLARWGCDYLYRTPKIRINCSDKYYFNGKMCMTFNVADIQWSGKTCTRLVIEDRFGDVVFDYTQGKRTIEEAITETQKTAKIAADALDRVNKLIPKFLYAKAVNAKTIDELKSIWDENTSWQENKNFKNVINKRKRTLQA